MHKILFIKKNLSIILLSVLLIFSLLILFTNSVFRFSSFEPEIMLKPQVENPEIANFPGFSFFDRANNYYYFQPEDFENSKNQLENFGDVNIKTNIDYSSIFDLIKITISLFLASVCLIFFSSFKNSNKTFADFLKVISTLAILNVSLLIINLGFISLVSIVYRINEIFLLVSVPSIILLNMFFTYKEKVSDFSKNLKSNLLKKNALILAIFVLTPAIGLGSNFVLLGMVLTTSFLFLYLNLNLGIFLLNIKLKPISIKFNKRSLPPEKKKKKK